MKIIEKLKQKWGVGIWGFLAIMAAFSLAGTSSVLVRKKMIFLPEDLPVFINILFFFPNLSDPPPYLWNHFGKVPLFLGKREKNVIVSPTSCYSQEKS